MGQKLLEDKLGVLSHSSGTITMAASTSNPARLTIGGQQYRITSNKTLAVGTATANTLYMIYAVISAGVPTLIKDTAVNSVGPSGYDSWKLVGAFNTRTANTWASFLTIEGVPTSNSYQLDGMTTSFTTNSSLFTNAARVGKYMELEIYESFSGTPSAGSGTYSLPGELTIDTSYLIDNGGNDVMIEGTASHWDSSVSRGIIGACRYSTNAIQFVHTLHDGVSSRVDFTTIGAGSMGSGDKIYMKVRLPITQWSNTPLKDL